MKLKFLGNGNAFNPYKSHNCAYFEKGANIVMLDCGADILKKIIRSGMLDGTIESFSIFITHLHSDHVGSLEPLITYFYHYVNDVELTVYYPNPHRLRKLLKLLGLNKPVKIKRIPKELFGMIVDFEKQKHIKGSYGYYFYYGEDSFFYSGDTGRISKRAVAELERGKIARIYHEVSNGDSKKHTSLERLNAAIPESLREKVTCMHFSSEELEMRCRREGYKISKEITIQ